MIVSERLPYTRYNRVVVNGQHYDATERETAPRVWLAAWRACHTDDRTEFDELVRRGALVPVSVPTAFVTLFECDHMPQHGVLRVLAGSEARDNGGPYLVIRRPLAVDFHGNMQYSRVGWLIESAHLLKVAERLKQRHAIALFRRYRVDIVDRDAVEVTPWP